ncbi:MAG: hypothetical protein QW728_01385 [Thermoplasmata archaeon]
MKVPRLPAGKELKEAKGGEGAFKQLMSFLQGGSFSGYLRINSLENERGAIGFIIFEKGKPVLVLRSQKKEEDFRKSSDALTELIHDSRINTTKITLFSVPADLAPQMEEFKVKYADGRFDYDAMTMKALYDMVEERFTNPAPQPKTEQPVKSEEKKVEEKKVEEKKPDKQEEKKEAIRPSSAQIPDFKIKSDNEPKLGLGKLGGGKKEEGAKEAFSENVSASPVIDQKDVFLKDILSKGSGEEEPLASQSASSALAKLKERLKIGAQMEGGAEGIFADKEAETLTAKEKAVAEGLSASKETVKPNTSEGVARTQTGETASTPQPKSSPLPPAQQNVSQQQNQPPAYAGASAGSDASVQPQAVQQPSPQQATEGPKPLFSKPLVFRSSDSGDGEPEKKITKKANIIRADESEAQKQPAPQLQMAGVQPMGGIPGTPPMQPASMQPGAFPQMQYPPGVQGQPSAIAQPGMQPQAPAAQFFPQQGIPQGQFMPGVGAMPQMSYMNYPSAQQMGINIFDTREYKELEERLRQKNQEIFYFQSQMDQRLQYENQKSLQTCAMYEEKIKGLNESIAKLNADLAQAKENFNKSLSVEQQKQKELQKTIEVKEGEISELQRQIVELHGELESKNNKISGLENKVEEMRATLNRQTFESLKRFKEMERRIAELAESSFAVIIESKKLEETQQ